MPEIIHTPADSGKVPQHRGTVRSFRWPLGDRDEISPCRDCEHWHAIVEVDGADDPYPELYLREWHSTDCPCWTADD